MVISNKCVGPVVFVARRRPTVDFVVGFVEFAEEMLIGLIPLFSLLGVE